jgi:uncharacterized protein
MDHNYSPESDAAASSTRLDQLAVVIFVAVVLTLTIGLILLPLPPLVAPAIVVFIPAIVAVILISLTEGRGRVRQRLFSREAWRIGLKWLLISLGLGIGLRLGVSLVGMVLAPDSRIAFDTLSPLVVIVYLFAAGEEIGWRGYALPRMLERGATPLVAALALGISWALLHLPLTLLGKLSAGSPPLAQFLTLISLAVILTWGYLGPRRSAGGPGEASPGGKATIREVVDSSPPAPTFFPLFVRQPRC